MKRIAQLLVLCWGLGLVLATGARAELKEEEKAEVVISDDRDSEETKDDRYWYSTDDEESFDKLVKEKGLEVEEINDKPDFSTANWGPWVVVPRDDRVVFQRYHNSLLLFYGNPMILRTVATTPIGADIKYSELAQKDEDNGDFGDSLLLELEKKDDPATAPSGDKDQKQPTEKTVVIRNEVVGGYDYQPVRKYTDVGVWVVVQPR